eukprot:3357046-Amphidinium_carterae.1
MQSEETKSDALCMMCRARLQGCLKRVGVGWYFGSNHCDRLVPILSSWHALSVHGFRHEPVR